MRLTLSGSVAGVVRRFDVMVDRLADLSPPLRAAGKEIRTDAKARIAAQQFMPLADSTVSYREGLRKKHITARGTIRAAYYRKLRSALFAQAKAGKASFSAQDELDRLYHGGSLAHNLEQASGDRKASRALERLRKGLQRYEEQTPKQRAGGKHQEAGKNKILGKIGTSLYATIENSTADVFSRIPWAGIHNHGGTAGHGAQIPERRFLEITAAVVQHLIDHLIDYVCSPSSEA